MTIKQAVDFWHSRKRKESFVEVAKVYAEIVLQIAHKRIYSIKNQDDINPFYIKSPSFDF
jgi:hypothetical protein